MSSDFDKSEPFKTVKFTHKNRKKSVIDSLESIYGKNSDSPSKKFSFRFSLPDFSDFSFAVGFGIVLILGTLLNIYFFTR